MKQLATSHILLGSAIALMLLPPTVFMVAAVHHGMGTAASLAALGDQYAAAKANLLVVSVLGLLPMLLVALVILVRKLRRLPPEGSVAYAWGGSIPVLAVAMFVNLEHWPSYLPARRFMGFPHGLEFVIGPFVFAPIGVVLGLLLAWWWSSRR